MAAESGDLLLPYLNRRDFSGAWFDTLGGPGDADEVADRFTAVDLVAQADLEGVFAMQNALDSIDGSGM